MNTEFVWSKMNIPDGDKIYAFHCDTIEGKLYVVTRVKNCNVYEYDITKEKWTSLTPKNNPWFDSTKLADVKMYTRMYDITIHDKKIFIMTAQGWNNITTANTYLPNIWCSEGDTIWERVDSGWCYYGNMHSDQVTEFISIDPFLYATTFSHGLWCYDGVSWMVMPGTTQKEVADIEDYNAIPGFRPRSMVKHNNDIFVGNLGGYVHKLLPGNTWDRYGLFYKDYLSNEIIQFTQMTMSLYSYGGYLIKQTYYYNDSADLWYNMTPYFDHFDKTYSNALPGTVYGMTNIGDTLFAALGNNEGKHSGVYFLDLNTRKWFNKK